MTKKAAADDAAPPSIEQLSKQIANSLAGGARTAELLEQIRVQLAAQNQLLGIGTIALVRLADLVEHESMIAFRGWSRCSDPHGLRKRLHGGLERLFELQEPTQDAGASG